MNIAISNLALDDDASLELCSRFLIKNVEIAPSKIASWENLDKETILKYNKKLNFHGMSAYSMQSLFYGIEAKSDKDILNHFEKIVFIAKLLNISVLVFGSPSLRNDSYSWNNILSEFDSMLDQSTITLCIEPNARVYKGSFFFTIDEIVKFLEENPKRNIKTMIDSHNLLYENQNPSEKFRQYKNHICHVHASEQKLSFITDTKIHCELAKTLEEENYTGTVTYELANSENLEKSIETFANIYGKEIHRL